MKHPFFHRQLGEILIEKGFASADQLTQILQSDEDGLLGERMEMAGFITSNHLAEALAGQFNLPYVDLDGGTISSELYHLIPATQAYRLEVVLYRFEDGTLEVVAADPRRYTLIEKLERIAKCRVRLLIGSSQAIARALQRSEGAAHLLSDVSQKFRLATAPMVEDNAVVAPSKMAEENSAPVINLVNTVMGAALQKRASDIHIEAHEKGVSIKFRIDGVLYPATAILDRQHHSSLISRVKVMSELDIAEKRIPQDGRYRSTVDGREIDFRVSILPGIFGEDVVIRILDKSSITEGMSNLSLDGLGISHEVLKKFRKSIHDPYGMVLITGPTGSGKTTTLYAALNELNDGHEKIITIEDPVEYQLEGIVQVPVNEKKKLTFARGLRSILRHDPDKIMIGEIRDSETVQIAVQSALTGHLVFTTVHANNAFDVIGRFAHMGADVPSFISSLNCVMAQRLLRKICPRCSEPVTLDHNLLKSSGLNPAEIADRPIYEGRGCSHCSGTGYRGRAAATEFLVLSSRVREMIVERRPITELHSAAIEEGMTTLRQSALDKVCSGETSLHEANRVTFVE